MYEYTQSDTNIINFSQFSSNNPSFSQLNTTCNSINKALLEWLKTATKDESLLHNHKTELLAKMTELNEYFVERIKGNTEVKQVVTTPKKDRRFKDKEFENNPFFDFLRQFYLVFSNWVNDVIE